MWQKYLVVVRQYFLKALEYRSEVVGWVAMNLVPNFTMLLIWVSVYQGASSVRGYTLPQILQYFLFGMLIDNITSTHFEQLRAREIRMGKIDHFMTKPLSYPVHVFFADIGGKLLFQFFSLPVFFVSYFVFSLFFPLASLPTSIVLIAQFVALLAGAYLIEFAFALFAVLLTFWFEGADGLEHFKWILVTVLGGWMVPISFMPLWLRQIVLALPLKFMYAIPIEVIQMKYVLSMNDILYLLISVIAMYFGLFFLWKKAVYKYSSAGG